MINANFQSVLLIFTNGANICGLQDRGFQW